MTETTLFKKLKAIAFTPAGRPRFTVTTPSAMADGGEVRIGKKKDSGCSCLCPLEAIAAAEGFEDVPEFGYAYEYRLAGSQLGLDTGFVNRFITAADNWACDIHEDNEEDAADIRRLRRRILKTCGLTELKEVA